MNLTETLQLALISLAIAALPVTLLLGAGFLIGWLLGAW